jgi:hypothetical protein
MGIQWGLACPNPYANPAHPKADVQAPLLGRLLISADYDNWEDQDFMLGGSPASAIAMPSLLDCFCPPSAGRVTPRAINIHWPFIGPTDSSSHKHPLALHWANQSRHYPCYWPQQPIKLYRIPGVHCRFGTSLLLPIILQTQSSHGEIQFLLLSGTTPGLDAGLGPAVLSLFYQQFPQSLVPSLASRCLSSTWRKMAHSN